MTRKKEPSGIIADGPKSGVILRSASPDAIAAANAGAREHLRRAMEDGDWASYENDLRARAQSYARRGLSFAGWHETASVFVCHMTPRLLRAYSDDPRRAEAAVVALLRFHDRRAVVLGEQFLRTKEEMVREAEAALRRSEVDLRSAQKLAAVGKLAGGVAHDFNNLLAVILSFTGLLLDGLPPDDARRADVEEIGKAASQAALLTRQLLAFSRRQVLQPCMLDMNETLLAMQKMLRRLLGEDIALSIRTADALGHVHADPGQIEQVVMNLVVNARDAMPRGGNLTIDTANVDLDACSGASLGLPPGAYVRIGRVGRGSGIARARRRRGDATDRRLAAFVREVPCRAEPRTKVVVIRLPEQV